MSTDPADTRWIVIRPAGDINDSELAEIHEGIWLERSDLDDDSAVELDGPDGVVHARPTDARETSPDGHVAQVYRVAPPDGAET